MNRPPRVGGAAELGDLFGRQAVSDEEGQVLAGIGIREPCGPKIRLPRVFAAVLAEILQYKRGRQVDASVERQGAVKERRLKALERRAVNHQGGLQLVCERLPLVQPPIHHPVGGFWVLGLERQVGVAGIRGHHSEDDRLERFELALLADVFKVQSEHVIAAFQDLARKKFRDGPPRRLDDIGVAVDLGREGLPDGRLQRRHPGGAGVLLDIERGAVLERRQLRDAFRSASGDRRLQRGGDDEFAGLAVADLLEADDVVFRVDVQERPRLLEFVEDVERHRLELGVVRVDRPADRDLSADGARELVEGRKARAAHPREGIRRVGGGLVVVRLHRGESDAVVGVALQPGADPAEDAGEEVLPRGAAWARIRELRHEPLDGAAESGRERRKALAGDRTVAALHVLEPLLEGVDPDDRIVHVGALGFAQRNADAVDRHAVVPDVLERGDVRVDLRGERLLDVLALVVREGVEERLQLLGEDPADAPAQVRAAVDAFLDRLDDALELALGELPELRGQGVITPLARLREQIVHGVRELGDRCGRGAVSGLRDRRPVDGLGGEESARGQHRGAGALGERPERQHRAAQRRESGRKRQAVLRRRPILCLERGEYVAGAFGERLHRRRQLPSRLLGHLPRENEVGLHVPEVFVGPH